MTQKGILLKKCWEAFFFLSVALAHKTNLQTRMHVSHTRFAQGLILTTVGFSHKH